jgi:sulfite exporter TauE/SafE/plastocyanin domain-containing protein
MEAGDTQTKVFRIMGMTCVNCQNRIEKKLKSLEGVEDANVNYNTGTAEIICSTTVIDFTAITDAITKLGYTVDEGNRRGSVVLQAAGALLIILALSALLRVFSVSSLAVSFPLAETGMGYGMLLVIGLLTSVHCIAMCGGINLSQTLGREKAEVSPAASKKPFDFSLLVPGILYNGGRVISYTAAGVIVGSLGSVISISVRFQSIIFLLAGAFMIIMGINMLGIFPAFGRLSLRLPRFFTKKINGQKNKRGPLVIGLLNGFLPCGPLQAMQLYALSTGSPVKGGISMLLFSIGTVPLMFTLGAAGGILSSVKEISFSRQAMRIGAVLVAAMGVVMFTNGLSSAGFSGPFDIAASSVPNFIQVERETVESEEQDGVQIVRSTLLPNRYPAITVQQGIPVRWIINAPPGSINGCNNRMIILEYGIQYTFKQGENVIEFIPKNAGRFRYSCWMNMIRSTITVLASGESIAEIQEPDTTPKPAGAKISAEAAAVARTAGNMQAVTIHLGGEGFEPAIVVMQRQLPALWTIVVDSPDPGGSSIIFPAYYAIIETEQGENQIEFVPAEDFEFYTVDTAFYGFVKIVDDINRIDIDAIKTEAADFETLIYPETYFESARGGCQCCQ